MARGAHTHSARALSARPTAIGFSLLLAIAGTAIWRPAVADPAMAGLVWAGLLAMLLIGAVWPFVVVLRTRVGLAGFPRDAVVGDDLRVRIDIDAPPPGSSIRFHEALGAVRQAPPSVPGSDTSFDEVIAMLRRRGVLRTLPVVLVSDAPFGFVRVTRTVELELASALHVGPRPDRTEAPVSEIGASAHQVTSGGPTAGGDTVRSVRPYVVGDPAHLVHWPSSARSAALVVRELEPPPDLGIAIVVDLGRPTAALDEWAAWELPQEPEEEAVASRACGAAMWALAEGATVLLCTSENGVASTTRVRTPTDVMRCLAAAGPGPTGVPGAEWPVMRLGVRKVR